MCLQYFWGSISFFLQHNICSIFAIITIYSMSYANLLLHDLGQILEFDTAVYSAEAPMLTGPTETTTID